MRGKRIISILCVLTLLLGMTFQVEATGLQEKRSSLAIWRKRRRLLSREKENLSQELEEIVADMAEIKEQIEAKEAELEKKEEELIQAQIDENDQYESMKNGSSICTRMAAASSLKFCSKQKILQIF